MNMHGCTDSCTYDFPLLKYSQEQSFAAADPVFKYIRVLNSEWNLSCTILLNDFYYFRRMCLIEAFWLVYPTIIW